MKDIKFNILSPLALKTQSLQSFITGALRSCSQIDLEILLNLVPMDILCVWK